MDLRTSGEGEGGMNRETGTGMHALTCVKYTNNKCWRGFIGEKEHRDVSEAASETLLHAQGVHPSAR